MFLSCESICEDLDGDMYIHNNYYVSAALMKPKRLKQFLVLCAETCLQLDSACVLGHTYTHIHTQYSSLVPRPFGGGGKAWGLLRAHARKLPQNVVIAYYSNLSAIFVSILAWERG